MSNALLAFSIVLACCSQPRADVVEVQKALVELDASVGRSPHAAAWHSYLGTDGLRQQLARPNGPEPEALARTLRRLTGDHDSLRSPPVLRLRIALERWLTTVTLPGGEHLADVAESIKHRFQPDSRSAGDDRSPSNRTLTRDEFASQLDSLIPQLREYANRPSPVLARQAGEALDSLAATKRADSLVTAVRRFYRYPNLWVVVSEDMLSQRGEQPIQRPTTVSQTILGTRITGSGHVVGKSDLTLVHGNQHAELKAIVTGTCYTTTVGRNGPAIIHSRTTTTFRSEKRILLSERGLQSLPAVTQARTSTIVMGIDSTLPRLRGRIVERVASRRVADSKGQAEAIAARFAEHRLNAAVNLEAERMLARLDRLAITPLLAVGGAGTTTHEDLWFRSVPGYLLIGRRGPLGSATLPAAELDGATVSLSFPAGMLSYFAADSLGKTTLGESRLGKALNRALGLSIFATREEAAEDPWSMTLAQDHPFAMEMLPTGLALTLRGSEFLSGGKTFEGMDVTANYLWAKTPAGYRFVRNEPFSFRTSTLERKASPAIAETVLKGMLETWFDTLMPKELSLFGGLTLGGEEDGINLGDVVRFNVQNNWVTLGYNPPNKGEQTQQAKRPISPGERGAVVPWGALRRE